MENNQCELNICEQLPRKFNCRSRYVVYSLTFKLCMETKNQYIGETCIWIKERINQNKTSTINKNSKHPYNSPKMEHFKLKIQWLN